jgi:hypothetical protein
MIPFRYNMLRQYLLDMHNRDAVFGTGNHVLPARRGHEET